MSQRVAGGLVCDFVGGPVGYRFRSEGGRGNALARACGFARGAVPSVIDATAGLGRDAFLLAGLGAHVTLIERSAPVHAALADGLARARLSDPRTAVVADRMTLLHGDSRFLLAAMSADVVLVDPMHPPRGNSALVKQEMRILRDLVGADPDAPELMQAAMLCARQRVVLKWPLRAAPMPGLVRPSHQILGKTTRYDVHVTGRSGD
jgi:16S rRNA (guanine1516-N2)-methyltransferase